MGGIKLISSNGSEDLHCFYSELNWRLSRLLYLCTVVSNELVYRLTLLL